MAVGKSGLGFAVSQSIREFTHKGVLTMCYCKNFAVVASIELKICLCARFRVSGLLGPFSAQLEHLLYCEHDLDDLDLCYALRLGKSRITFVSQVHKPLLYIWQSGLLSVGLPGW